MATIVVHDGDEVWEGEGDLWRTITPWGHLVPAARLAADHINRKFPSAEHVMYWPRELGDPFMPALRADEV